MNKLKTKFAILCSFCFMLYSGNVLAQNATFTFYDVQTGFSIVPEEVTLYDAESRALKNSFTKKDLSRGEAIEMDLKAGDYNLAVSALGYKAMDIGFSATKDMRINRKVMLSPQDAPVEVSASYLRALHRPDRTIITGYVADDKGIPVADALIQSDDGATAHTNKKGYFQLSLSYDKEDFHDVQLKAFNVTKSGFKTERKEKVVVMPNGDAVYRIQLERGKGQNTQEVSDFIIENDEIIGRPERQMPALDEPFFPEPTSKSGQLKSAAECLPQTISVGYQSDFSYCCTSCANVIVLDLEEYTKRCIDNEWLSGWSNLNNIAEAYKAAAIAVRTYGAFRVYNSRNGYNVAASTCDQVYDHTSTSWSISAGDATAGTVLKVNDSFVKAEYSSENNNLGGTSCSGTQAGAGCGNGFCKDGISGTCISDPLGTNKIQFGHGRNMSQFGSARWATGLAIGNWCVGNAYNGSSHGQGTRTWQQIISMYYPSHDLVNCNDTGGSTTCNYTITNATTCTYKIWLWDDGWTFGATLNGNSSVNLTLEDGTSFAAYNEAATQTATGFVGIDCNNPSYTITQSICNTNTCDKPTNVTTSNPTSSTCTLSWNAVNGASGYSLIYYSWDDSQWVEFATDFPGTTAVISQLGAGTYWCFAVKASCNGTLSSQSEYSCISTLNALVSGQQSTGEIVALETTASLKTNEEVEVKVYPNPFRDLGTIEFSLLQDAQVTIIISDVTGKQVSVLADKETTSSGTHQFTFDGSRFASGVYYCTLVANEYTSVQKMILTK